MTVIPWVDFLGAVQVQLQKVVTYTYAHNPTVTIDYVLEEYAGNGYSATGTFTTAVGRLGMMWRRFPSTGAVTRYMINNSLQYYDVSDFSAFILAKTNIEEFSIAPHSITNDTANVDGWGYFDTSGTYRNYSETSSLRDLVQEYTGRKLHGSKDDGRDAFLSSVTITNYDAGSIQLYAAGEELNLGLGGATNLGTGTGHTSAPFIDTGTGISIMANARKKKRDFLW